MKILFTIPLLVICSVSVFATGQQADLIVYQNEERPLFSNPLEGYYANGRARPRYMIGPLTMSSGNWRGYVATWQIDDGQLYLKKIDSWLCNGSTKESCAPVKLTQLFPGKVRDGRVRADWFSGELRIPDGKRLQYVHMGYGSTFERDIIFTVKRGVASDYHIVDNSKAELPTESDAARKELEELRVAETRKKRLPKERAKRPPTSGIMIVPGKSVFRHGARKEDLEAIIGEGEPGSKYDDVYFVDYPAVGVQVSYDNRKNTVHVIFLYNNAPRYDGFTVPKVLTDKGIGWDATAEDILKVYGKPLKDYDDESKTWRRLEYPGIDFLFGGTKLGRIGILGPDGN